MTDEAARVASAVEGVDLQPCGGTHVGDSAWLVRGSGLVVGPGDADELAAATERLLADDVDARGLQLGQCAGEICDVHQRDPLEPAARSLGHGGGDRRRVTVLLDQRGRAECGSGAQDGADIAGIARLIEREHRRAVLSVGGRDDVFQMAIGQGIDLRRNALMDRVISDQTADFAAACGA